MGECEGKHVIVTPRHSIPDTTVLPPANPSNILDVWHCVHSCV